jgi:hypothetical protein
MFKMIPKVAEGSWVIKQSVGTTPVIIGRKLGTSFHITQKYVEVAVDVGSSSTAQYITGMVRECGRARCSLLWHGGNTAAAGGEVVNLSEQRDAK